MGMVSLALRVKSLEINEHTCAKRPEILGRLFQSKINQLAASRSVLSVNGHIQTNLGNHIGTQFHNNTSGGFTTDGDVEVALGV